MESERERGKRMKKIGCLTLSLLILSVVFVGLVSCGKGGASDVTTYAETAAVTAAETEEILYEIPTVYNGHDILEGTYTIGGTTFSFKYSDGFFEVDPKEYQTHMATTSMSLSYSATKGPAGDDYTACYDQTLSMFRQIGFDNVYVSPSYNVEPTADSVACVIAEKAVECQRGTTNVVAIVLRSGSYCSEWASNFRLGSEGESAGIASAADQVIGYFSDFLSENPDLTTALEDGKVAFWVQGYSRGGGVANLTAKRLVDLYQPSGNDVYGYPIDGQMGGVKSAEIPGRDYTVIHNVVNPNDLVPYLAPARMGFKRYGLDHYLFSGKADVNNPILDANGDPVSDNKRLVTMSVKRITLAKKHLVEMLGDVPAVDRYTPYAVSYKAINLFTRELADVERKTMTANFLYDFMNGLTETADGDPVTTRESFVSSGMEAALGRLMVFFYSGVDFSGFTDIDPLKEIAYAVLEECKDALTESAYWGNYGKMTVSLHGDIARILTEALVPRLREVETLRTLLAEYPEGGADRAFDDLAILVHRFLYAISDIDDLVTFALNAVSLTGNHEYLANLALLRSYDSWFEPTITD